MTVTRTWMLLIAAQLAASYAQEVAKRAPHGFVGMRGKKYIDSADFEHYYKRRPQFFVGEKGKKSLLDSVEDPLYYKRAPMGFVGMRGKKDYLDSALPYPDNYDYPPKLGGSLIGQIDYSADEMKNANDVDYSLLNQLVNYLKCLERQRPDGAEDDDSIAPTSEEASDERITNEVDKRAANAHQFYGVRGKKSLQNKRPYDLTFRGKFIGVRGKKDLKNSGPQEIKFLVDQSMPWPKRKAQMGFVGMRGKKWTDDSSAEAEASTN